MPDVEPTVERAAPVDLRMPWLAAAAWGGGLVAGAPWWVSVAGFAVGLAFALTRRRLTARATVLAGLLVAGGVLVSASVRSEAVASGPVADLAEERAVVELVGEVRSDPRPVTGRFGEQVVVRLEVHEVVGRGLRHRVAVPVLVIGDPAWSATRLGATVRTTGRLVPGDEGVGALVSGASPPVTIARPDVWWRAAGAVRSSIRDAVAHRPADQRVLVPALVDGDDVGLDPALEADFRTTGLTHLTAVSGTNLTLVVGFLLVCARWCHVRGRWLVLVAVLGIVGFVLLARTEPSVLRAAAMGTVGLVALHHRSGRAFRSLSVAVVVLLLLQPALATAPGFVLSVLATAGIVVLAPGWRDALARWLPRPLAEAIAVPAAAQLACTPVVAALSGQVSLVAVAANLLVAPVVGPATVLGLLGGVVALVSDPLGRVLGTGAGWCVGWIVAVARRGADLPLAALGWGTGGGSLLLLTLVCLGAAVVAPALLRRPRWVVPMVVGAVLLTCVPWPSPGWPPTDWVMAVCDVGQGDALVLRTAPGAGIVIDTGPDPTAVDGCLDRLGVVSVPLLVLTHFHADHVDGLAGVLDGRAVGEVWTTRILDPPAGVEEVDRLLAAAGLQAGQPASGARQIGDVVVQAVWPPAGPVRTGPGDGSTANDASVVLVAESHGVRILLTGDVEPPAQQTLAAALPGLEVDVLKVPHHGSRYQDVAWLESLGATLALVSVGADNDYGHPAPDLLDQLGESGAEVGRTDLDGDLIVVAGQDGPELRTR